MEHDELEEICDGEAMCEDSEGDHAGDSEDEYADDATEVVDLVQPYLPPSCEDQDDEEELPPFKRETRTPSSVRVTSGRYS